MFGLKSENPAAPHEDSVQVHGQDGEAKDLVNLCRGAAVANYKNCEKNDMRKEEGMLRDDSQILFNQSLHVPACVCIYACDNYIRIQYVYKYINIYMCVYICCKLCCILLHAMQKNAMARTLYGSSFVKMRLMTSASETLSHKRRTVDSMTNTQLAVRLQVAQISNP